MSTRAKGTQRGITLIELIVFMVIVSVGLAGVLTALNVAVRSSADPLRPIQALAIAEGLLEEILLKGYCDPDSINSTTTPPTCGANGAEARADYDAVRDYDAAGAGTAIASDALGNPWPSGYTATVTVSTTALGSIADALRILVSVNYGGGSVSLTGYRTNY